MWKYKTTYKCIFICIDYTWEHIYHEFSYCGFISSQLNPFGLITRFVVAIIISFWYQSHYGQFCEKIPLERCWLYVVLKLWLAYGKKEIIYILNNSLFDILLIS